MKYCVTDCNPPGDHQAAFATVIPFEDLDVLKIKMEEFNHGKLSTDINVYLTNDIQDAMIVWAKLLINDDDVSDRIFDPDDVEPEMQDISVIFLCNQDGFVI